MPDESNKLYLYEALELRAEYNRMINMLNRLKPENCKSPYDSEVLEPVDDFELSELNKKIKIMKFKLRKLNSAIQKANYENIVEINDEEITLMEALDYRKSTEEELDQCVARLQDSAYKVVNHMDSRTVADKPQESYQSVVKEYYMLIDRFRELNKAIRKASFEIVVDFHGETYHELEKRNSL